MGRMSDKYIEEMEKMNGREEDGYDEWRVDEAYEKSAGAKIPEWKANIREAFHTVGYKPPHMVKDVLVNSRFMEYLYPDNAGEYFFTTIWDMSMNAFNKPREVQVVVDDEYNLFISAGTTSFVSFDDDEEQLAGMKLPIRCWIHTHPMGKAFFSGTDWRTINTWRPIMKSAVVLGDNQYLAYDCKTEICKHVFYGIYEQPNAKKIGGNEDE